MPQFEDSNISLARDVDASAEDAHLLKEMSRLPREMLYLLRARDGQGRTGSGSKKCWIRRALDLLVSPNFGICDATQSFSC